MVYIDQTVFKMIVNTLWETIIFVWEIIMCLLLVNFMLPSTALSEDTPFTIHIV